MQKKLDLLNALNKISPHVKAYLKEEMPERFHFKNNIRIGNFT